MKVAVTGGTGFLGRHVVDRLVAAGHEPVCMVRPTSDTMHLQQAGVATVQATLDDPDSLGALVHGADAVIHLAGLVKARTKKDFHRVNGDGTRHLAEAAVDAGVEQFTLVSSIAAKGPAPDPEPAPAGLGTTPVSHYGRSKAAGEKALLSNGDDLSVRIVRPPVVYGPGDRALLDLFKAVQRGVFPMAGPKDALFSTVYAPDCADCIVQATLHDEQGPLVVEPTDGPPHTWAAFRDAVADAVGRSKVRTIRTPSMMVGAVGAVNQLAMGLLGKAPKLGRDKAREIRHAYWLADGDSTQERLGWTPSVDLQEGTLRTAQWYRDQGLL